MCRGRGWWRRNRHSCTCSARASNVCPPTQPWSWRNVLVSCMAQVAHGAPRATLGVARCMRRNRRASNGPLEGERVRQGLVQVVGREHEARVERVIRPWDCPRHVARPRPAKAGHGQHTVSTRSAHGQQTLAGGVLLRCRSFWGRTAANPILFVTLPHNLRGPHVVRECGGATALTGPRNVSARGWCSS